MGGGRGRRGIQDRGWCLCRVCLTEALYDCGYVSNIGIPRESVEYINTGNTYGNIGRVPLPIPRYQAS
jgi:hypothetical protein